VRPAGDLGDAPLGKLAAIESTPLAASTPVKAAPVNCEP